MRTAQYDEDDGYNGVNVELVANYQDACLEEMPNRCSVEIWKILSLQFE